MDETKLVFSAEAIGKIIAKSVKVDGMIVRKVNLTYKSVPSGDRGETYDTVIFAEAILDAE